MELLAQLSLATQRVVLAVFPQGGQQHARRNAWQQTSACRRLARDHSMAEQAIAAGPAAAVRPA